MGSSAVRFRVLSALRPDSQRKLQEFSRDHNRKKVAPRMGRNGDLGIYEVYDSVAALEAHRATDHFKKYAATTGGMVAKRDVRAMTSVAINAKAR